RRRAADARVARGVPAAVGQGQQLLGVPGRGRRAALAGPRLGAAGGARPRARVRPVAADAGAAGGVAAGGIAALRDGALPAPSPPAPTPALPASGGGSQRSHAPAPSPACGGRPGWGHATKPRCPTVPPRPPPPSPAERHGQLPLAGVEIAPPKLSGRPRGRTRPPAHPCPPPEPGRAPRPPPPSPAASHGQFPLAGVEFAHLNLSGCPSGRSRPPANPCHPAEPGRAPRPRARRPRRSYIHDLRTDWTLRPRAGRVLPHP